MAISTKVIEAVTRPHFTVNCWCSPATCECCGGVAHRIVDMRPDDQSRMAAFSGL